MRRALLIAVGLLAGCVKHWHVDVPGTADGNACVRECMQVRASCEGGSRSYAVIDDCRHQQGECELTCPGARKVEE